MGGGGPLYPSNGKTKARKSLRVNPSKVHFAEWKYCTDFCRCSSICFNYFHSRCLLKYQVCLSLKQIKVSKMCKNKTGNCKKSQCVKLSRKRTTTLHSFSFVHFAESKCFSRKSPLSDFSKGNKYTPQSYVYLDINTHALRNRQLNSASLVGDLPSVFCLFKKPLILSLSLCFSPASEHRVNRHSDI